MKAVYAGTFDPFTNGHWDLVERSSHVFENLTIAVGNGSGKLPLLNAGERKTIITEAVGELKNVTVDIFDGLLVNYCKSIGAKIIVRGLRALSDFEAELAMAHTNYMLDHNIDTFFLVTKTENSYVSSSMVREVARLGGDITPFVPPYAAKFLLRKLRG